MLFRSQYFKMMSLVIILVVMASCTRESKKTAIEINLGSQNGAQSTQIRGVIINITATGMTPIYYSKFNDNGGIGLTHMIEVPAGSDRLFQALVVSYDTQTEQETFKYGELKKTLSAANETLPIVATTLGGMNPREARVAGRYEKDSLFPSGTILVKLHPNTQSPPMLVTRDLMLAGWFDTFGIVAPDIRFSYELEQTGEKLFENINFDDASLSAPFANSSAWNLKFSVPEHYRFLGANSAAPHFRPIPEMDVYLGYYKFDTSTNSFITNSINIMYPPSLAFTNLYSTNTFSGAPGSIVPTGTLLTYQVGTDNDPLTINRNRGGTNGTCATPFGAQLCLRADLFNEDSYRATGFEPPFQYLSSSEGYGSVTSSVAKNFTQIRWRYLPGIDNGIFGIKGFDVYAKENFKTTEGSEGYNCNTLTTLGYKLRKTADVASGNPTSSTSLQSLNVYEVDGNDDVVVCPYYMVGVTKTYYSVAQKVYVGTPDEISGRVRLESLNSPGRISFAKDTCEPWKASLIDKYGSAIAVSAPRTLRLATHDSTGGIAYFKDPSCKQSITHLSLTSGQSSANFYVKSEIVSPNTYHSSNSYLEAYVHPDMPGIKREIAFAQSGTWTTHAAYPSTLKASTGRCYPIDFRFSFSNNTPILILAARTVTYQSSEASTEFFETSDCSGSKVTSTVVPSGQAYARLYMKSYSPNTETLTLETRNAADSANLNASVTVTKVVSNAYDTNAFAFLPLAHRYEIGDCMPYTFAASEEPEYFTPTFALGTAISVPSVALNTPGNQAQSTVDPTCTTGLAPFSGQSIPVNMWKTSLSYIKNQNYAEKIPLLIGGISNTTTTMTVLPADLLVGLDNNLDGTLDVILQNEYTDIPVTATGCMGLMFQLKTANGTDYTFHTYSMPVTLTVPSALGDTFSDNTCTTSSAASSTFSPSLSDGATLFLNRNAGQNGEVLIRLNFGPSGSYGTVYRRLRFE